MSEDSRRLIDPRLTPNGGNGAGDGPDMPPATRRYAMTRIGAGDYLLPSNDGTVIWRIRSYEEDGSAEVESWDGKRRKLTGRFWAVHRYTGRDPHSVSADWSEWVTYDTTLRTRNDAIRAALNAKGKP